MTNPLILEMSDEDREREKEIRRQFRKTASGTFVDMVTKERTAPGVAAALENAIGFAELMTSKFRHPDTPSVACCAGCSWCCYQTIAVSAPEIFRLVDFLRESLTGERLQSVVERLRGLDRETRGMTATTRDKLRLPCAFLVDSRCSVYPARPLACMGFTSFDAKACERAQRFGFDKVEVVQEKGRMIFFRETGRGISDALSALSPRVDSRPLELTAAVLTCLDTPDSEDRWLAGDPIFEDGHLRFEQADLNRGPRGEVE